MAEHRLVKCSVRLYEDDVELIQAHYSDLGYNRILRHLTNRLAEKIRQNRANALSELEKSIDD